MPNKYLVTGGGGFLGHAICRKLIQSGNEVVSISRNKYQALEELGVTQYITDIADYSSFSKDAFQGADCVFHVAAKVDMWGKYDDFFRINVKGTENVIKSCLENGVKKLVYTSSPSVIADGTDLCGIDESYPYPFEYKAYYPHTKALAEIEVLSSNCKDLFTIALRPHLIWGPGDTHLIPIILKKAREGKLIRIGTGTNLVDTCFIEDCVSAHLSAMKALEINPVSRGNVYFISQGEPILLWDWINEILLRSNMQKIKRSIPKSLAYFLAGLLENISNFMPGNPEPRLTRFLVSEMATSHYFNICSAKNDLGFEPHYSIKRGMELTFPSL